MGELALDIMIGLAGLCAALIFLVFILRIRTGMPAVIFVCFFLLLSGASSYMPLFARAKGLWRWAALFAMGGAVLLYLQRITNPRNRLTPVHWGWAALLIYAYCLLPLVPTSQDRWFSLQSCGVVTLMVVAAFGTIWLYASDPRRIVEIVDVVWKMLMCILVLGLAFIALGGIQTVVGGWRYQGFFNNPNWNGNFCGIALPVLLWRMQYPRSRAQSWLIKLLALGAFMNIIASGSRGAIVGSILAGAIALWRLRREMLVRNLGIIIIVVMAILASQAAPGLVARLLEKQLPALVRTESFGTFTHRTEMWAHAWPTIVDHLPLGMGLGLSRFYSGLEGTTSRDVGAIQGHLHSQHIVNLAEFGVFGFSLMIAFFLYIAIVGARLWRMRRTPMGDLGICLCCTCLMVMCDSILHGWMTSAGSPYALIFWCLVAILLKSRVFAREEAARGHGRLAVRSPSASSIAAVPR